MRPSRLMSRRKGSSFGSKPTPGGRSAKSGGESLRYCPIMPRRVPSARFLITVRENICTAVQRKGPKRARRRLKISSQSIEEVREAANIIEVVSEFTALKRQGINYIGLCPYHQEKTPSFSVSPEKNFYYCFGCSKGGDAIKMVMELKSFSFAEAFSPLAERCGVGHGFEAPPQRRHRAAPRRTPLRPPAYKARAAPTAYSHKYPHKPPAAKEARQYLKCRGFEKSTIE